jgi:cobalamin biosynthesis Mg chelatase CobN
VFCGKQRTELIEETESEIIAAVAALNANYCPAEGLGTGVWNVGVIL